MDPADRQDRVTSGYVWLAEQADGAVLRPLRLWRLSPQHPIAEDLAGTIGRAVLGPRQFQPLSNCLAMTMRWIWLVPS
jgi:hypothetical protein